jgi:uncharacterized membrane protein YGL010W
MNQWERMMVFYGQAHRNPINIAIHMVGVPIIVGSVFIAAAWLQFEVGGLTVHGSWIAALLGLTYYFTLDRFFALAIAPLLVILVLGANELAELPFQESAIWSAGGFFGGYAAQFIGHAIEGRKPSLFQNPVLAMITAPLFVVAEFLALLGMRKDLFAKVKTEIERLDQVAA